MKLLIAISASIVVALVVTLYIDYFLTGNEILKEVTQATEEMVVEVEKRQQLIEELEELVAKTPPTEQEIIVNFYQQREKAVQELRDLCDFPIVARCYTSQEAVARSRWGVKNPRDCWCPDGRVR